MNAWRRREGRHMGAGGRRWLDLSTPPSTALNLITKLISKVCAHAWKMKEEEGRPRPLAKDNEDVRSATIARVAEPKKRSSLARMSNVSAHQGLPSLLLFPLDSQVSPSDAAPPPPPPPRSSRPFLFYSPYLVTEFGRRRRRPMPLGLRPSLFPLSVEEEAAHKSPHSAF